MTELEFKALAAQGYNRIPVMLQTLADLDSPLGLYLKLTDSANRRNSFLLESVVGGERFGRYSFIGLPARTAIRAKGAHIEVVRDGQVIEAVEGDPLAFVQQYQRRNRVHLLPGLPRFCGGLAGYFGYDVVHFIEPKVGNVEKPDPIGVPDLLLLVVDELAIIDNLSGMIYLIVYADPSEPEAYGKARERLHELRMRMRNAALAPEDLVMGGSGHAAHTPIERPFAKEDYLATVAVAREHIIAGDLMQVQIGQMLRKPFAHSPLSLYRALRSINPSPYMYYYDFGDFHVAGSSPEILVRQEKGPEPRVILRPIAGTRKRGLTEADDARAAEELLADPQERAGPAPVPSRLPSSWPSRSTRMSSTSSPTSRASSRKRWTPLTCCVPPSRPARSPARPRCEPWNSSSSWSPSSAASMAAPAATSAIRARWTWPSPFVPACSRTAS